MSIAHRQRHGMSKTPEYQAWLNMKRRCYDKKNKEFFRYGGTGVTVCDEWRKNFLSFYNYIGRRPSKNHSLDRIDTNGNYMPNNVRWANDTIQSINRRAFGNIRFKGVTQVAENTYRARVTYLGERIHIGRFSTKEEAAYMYDCFILCLYEGELSTNFEYY